MAYRIPTVTKYRNKRTEFKGITFASKAEATRYAQLLHLESAKEISDIKIQERFKLAVNGHHICTYVCDFSYTDHGKRVVEDVKSKPTELAVYKLKRALMLAIHGITITEVFVK